jgi:hypothetical protein
MLSTFYIIKKGKVFYLSFADEKIQLKQAISGCFECVLI